MNEDALSCSFCGKLEYEVKALIRGPSVLICNECVEQCVDVLKEKASIEVAAVAVPWQLAFWELWGTDL